MQYPPSSCQLIEIKTEVDPSIFDFGKPFYIRWYAQLKMLIEKGTDQETRED